MKRTTSIALLTLFVLLSLPLVAFAGEDGTALYTAKCKMCHGPDGKKLAKADLASDAIQAKDDATLVKFLTTDAKHKAKVPDEASAKALVVYLRTLKAKK